MKNNAGIKLSNIDSVAKYSKLYLEAFDNCEIYCGWDKNGSCYPHISYSHDYINTKYSNKQMIWAFALDIFHYIYSNPWTQSLKGKRILIVSPFEDTIFLILTQLIMKTIMKQIVNHNLIYLKQTMFLVI